MKGAKVRSVAGMPRPEPGKIFSMQPTRVGPLPVDWPVGMLFPRAVELGRARHARPSERVAFLVHGLAMNEDYFGLLAPELIARGYDVWALRLPGYSGSGEHSGALRPFHVGFSTAFYGWVVVSALAQLVRTLDPPPRRLLAWGHSLGAVALAAGITAWHGAGSPDVHQLVFEAPSFPEAVAFSGPAIALITALPDSVAGPFARALLMDDLASSRFAAQQALPLVPGRTSRLMLNMHALALANPLSRTVPPPPDVLKRSWFVIGRFDRLVDHGRLVGLLDTWQVTAQRRLLLPRNHWLSLTCPREILAWLAIT